MCRHLKLQTITCSVTLTVQHEDSDIRKLKKNYILKKPCILMTPTHSSSKPCMVAYLAAVVYYQHCHRQVAAP